VQLVDVAAQFRAAPGLRDEFVLERLKIRFPIDELRQFAGEVLDAATAAVTPSPTKRPTPRSIAVPARRTIM
jgi:hypothetical protein